MKKRKGIKLWLLILTCMLCVVGFSGTACYSKAANDKTTTETKQFDIQATFGFDNVARVGKAMLANVTVTNNGADFSGLVQILIPVTDGNNVMYQNELSIAAGETKQLSMPMYLNSYTGKLVVNVTDENENIIAKQRVKVNLLTEQDSTKMVAILTDNKDVLGYWEEKEKKIFYLSEKDMPEKEVGLEALDILIVNDFDTQNLNKNQYKALKDWVSKGGNLVIGTGAGANRTLGVFEDDFLTGSFEAVDKDGKVSFDVKDATVFSDKKNDISMQQVKKDKGAVLVFSTDLGVDYAKWKKKGTAYKDMVYDHIVEERTTNQYRYYSDSYGLDLTDKGNLPSLKKYAVVLLIYVVVVSWILYFVLKKKDKLEWTWGFVPLIALIFAIVVYGMGAATRITEPFITYTRVVEWTGEDAKSGTGSARMAITSPYNEKYSVAVPKGVTAYAGMRDVDYYEESETDFKDYKIGFRQSGDQQIITLNNLAAFETGTIRTDEMVSINGSYKADISCDKYQFKGTFTNKTGREIRNAVFLADGRIYSLGTIKAGETVKISEKSKNTLCFVMDYYTSILGYGYLSEAFGMSANYYDECETLEEERFGRAASYYLTEKGKNIFTQARVIGIMESDGADEDMSQSWGMDCSGITVSVFPIDVDYTDKNNQTFVPDLVSYGTVGDGMDEEYHSMYNGELTVEYSLKSNETLTGLYYLADVNETISGKGKNNKTTICSDYSSFDGTISAYDYKAKDYVKIFDGDEAGEVTDVKRFVGEDNKVLLKIKGKDTDKEYDIPVISATKEVK